MSLIRIEGFDNYLTPAQVNQSRGFFQWSSGGIGRFTPSQFGGQAAVMGASGLGGTCSVPFNGGAVIGHSMIMGSGTTTTNGVGGISVWNSLTQAPIGIGGTPNVVQCSVIYWGPGYVSINRGIGGSGPGNLATFGPNLFASNASFHTEAKFVIGPSGAITVRINGQIVGSVSGVNTQFGSSAVIDSVLLGAGFLDSNAVVDDVYIEDFVAGPGALPFNDFLGPVRVVTRFVTSAGSQTQWTALAGANYTQVEEQGMDSDATYNYDPGTVGHADLFQATQLPTTLLPLAVQMKGAYRQDNAGTRAVGNLMTSAASTNLGTAPVCDQTYEFLVEQNDVYPQDPGAGPAAWTLAAVNASQIGYKVAS